MKLKRLSVFAIVLSIVFSMLPTTFVNAAADASSEIESNLSGYKVVNTQTVANDGVIGIPVKITSYYDTANGTVTDKAGGTPIVMYFINTNTERIGTKSDVEIITSMLERGYLVTVVDYQNNVKAVSPELEYSAQKLRNNLQTGAYFSGSAFSGGKDYRETYVVPAGYDISLDNVYWEIDKHSAAGTLEEIVTEWNKDFRNTYADTLIKWTDASGSRKTTQNAFDGTAPKWYNANGREDANGQYTYIKFTKAESIEDCVKPDGTPLDFNLYMYLIYPTSPVNEVPVMALAGSSECLAMSAATSDRPQLNGFSFNGYAVASFDYGYVPMAREDHYGYFDGARGDAQYGTGINTVYSIQFWNDKTINTAAMRYIRYLADTQSSTYKFDDTAIGVYGNSKGGWMMFLGQEHPELLEPNRYFEGHHGETRLEAGEGAIGTAIDAPEAQPWAGYDSGADLVYASCGYASEGIAEGHAPVFIGSNINDGGSWINAELYVNLCREYDIPSLYTEAYLGHAFISGKDSRQGFDIYNAFFDFVDYYLKDESAKVVYIDADEVIGADDEITVKFAGQVSASEIAKVTVKDEDNTAIDGTWASAYGHSEWTFKPDASYTRGKAHTITVPATLKGENGVALGTAVTKDFSVNAANVTIAETVKNGGNLYMTVDVPVSANTDASLDTYKLTFDVNNDASNIADVYVVTNYNAQNPSAATEKFKLGSVNLKGKGTYSVDITDYIKSLNGVSTVTLKIKPQRTVASIPKFSNSLAGLNFSGGTLLSSGVKARENNAAAPGGSTALKVTEFNMYTYYSSKGYVYYENPIDIFRSNGIGTVTAADYGKKFHISFDVYDTISRDGTVRLNSYSSYNGTRDTDFERNVYNITTTKDAWKTIEFDYVVSETATVDSLAKTLTVAFNSTGNANQPLYLKNLVITETVSAIDFGGAELVCDEFYTEPPNPLETPYGTIPNTYESIEEYPFVTFNTSNNSFGGAYANYGSMLGAVRWNSANTVMYLRRDYTISKATDVYGNLGHHTASPTVIDLGGNTITTASDVSTGLISAGVRGETDSRNISITVKNGKIDTTSQYATEISDSVDYGNRTDSVTSHFDITYDNVEFILPANASDKLVHYSGERLHTSDNTIIFTNCTFDLTATTSGTLFKAGNTGNTKNFITDITVSGGQIKGQNMSSVTLATDANADSSVLFAKNSEGKYPTVLLPASASAPAGTVNTAQGKMAYTASKDVYANKEYSLEPSLQKWIIVDYANGGNAITGDYTGTKHTVWSGATGSRKASIGGKEANDYADVITKTASWSAPYTRPEWVASYPVFEATTFTAKADVYASAAGDKIYIDMDLYQGSTKISREFGLGSKTEYPVTYNGGSYTAGKWYTIGVTVNTATDKVVYFVNGEYVGEETITDISGIGGDFRIQFNGSTAGTYAVDNMTIVEGLEPYTYPPVVEGTFANGQNAITGTYTGTRSFQWFNLSDSTNSIVAGLGGKTATDYAIAVTKTGTAWAGPDVRPSWVASYPTLEADKFTAEAQVYGGTREGENIFFNVKFVTESGTTSKTFGLGGNESIAVKYNNGQYNLGEWYKLAVEGDSKTDTVKFYVNGEHIGSTTVDGLTGVSTDLRTQFSGTAKGTFAMDNLRIYQGEYKGDSFEGPEIVTGVYGATAASIEGATCIMNENREVVSTIGTNCVAVFTDGEIYRYVPISLSAEDRDLTRLDGSVTDYGDTKNIGFIVEGIDGDEVGLYKTIYIWDSVNGKRRANFKSVFSTAITGGTVDLGLVVYNVPAGVADEIELTFSSDTN